MLPIKSSSDDKPAFKHGFRAKVSSPPPQGAPAVSHNTTRLYWMVFALYKCHILSDAVTVLFWIFFIYSLFFVGESPSLVKNVDIEFEIKPQHSIWRGNMAADQPFLTHCSCWFRSFPIYADVPCQCWPRKGLTSKGIIYSTMITFVLMHIGNSLFQQK